jgi:hypothetical protein
VSSTWWFCLRHSEVEPDEGCANTDRMGPYASRAEAGRALERARERTAEWDADPRWNDEH